jgi:hypothetical protein
VRMTRNTCISAVSCIACIQRLLWGSCPL